MIQLLLPVPCFMAFGAALGCELADVPGFPWMFVVVGLWFVLQFAATLIVVKSGRA